MKPVEAISILRTLQGNYIGGYISEAINMAIEALEPETKKCPVCGSDLHEYCFMCCYEGKKVKSDGEHQT